MSSNDDLQWVIVNASAAISWLCCVCRSLSFFFKIDKPDKTIFSGRSEPQLYRNSENVLKIKGGSMAHFGQPLENYSLFLFDQDGI